MKKNILWSIMALMAVAMLSLGFAACGDDDDKNVSLIGRWETVDLAGNRLVLQFGEADYVLYTKYSEGTPVDQKNLKYKMESEQKGIISDWDGFGDYRYFTIVDNKLYFYASGYGKDLLEVFIKK
jgi:hypothetical protein